MLPWRLPCSIVVATMLPIFSQWIGWARCVLLQIMGQVQDSEWKTHERDRDDLWNLDGMVQIQYDENKPEKKYDEIWNGWALMYQPSCHSCKKIAGGACTADRGAHLENIHTYTKFLGYIHRVYIKNISALFHFTSRLHWNFTQVRLVYTGYTYSGQFFTCLEAF